MLLENRSLIFLATKDTEYTKFIVFIVAFPDSNDETAPPSSSDLSSKNSNNDWLTDDDDDDDEENLDEGLRLNAQAARKPTKKPTAAPLTNSK